MSIRNFSSVVGIILFLGGFGLLLLAPLLDNEPQTLNFLSSAPAIWGFILMALSVPISGLLGIFEKK